MADEAGKKGSEGEAKKPEDISTKLTFTTLNVLSRLREMFTTWVTLLTGVAGLVLAGVSLKQFVDAPADVPAALVWQAVGGMAALLVGVLAVIATAGLAASQSAARQSEAFSDTHVDPIRFFPRESAAELLEEFRFEANAYRAAKAHQDIEGMRYSEAWLKMYASSLWTWLEVYRGRVVAERAGKYVGAIFISAVIGGAGGIVFANALRQMKDTRPPGVILQGPKDGVIGFVSEKQEDLLACANASLDGQEYKNAKLDVTIMSVSIVIPVKDEKVPDYEATIVPTLASNSKCKVKLYTVNSDDVTVNIKAEVPEKKTADKPASGAPEGGAAKP